MATSYETSGYINSTPESVIQYVADPRNRPLFFTSVKSITDIQGDPTAEGTTWKWTFVALGLEFQGKGRCVKHEPGRLYSFKTEGGIASTFSYRAEPEGKRTRLTITVEYEVPDNARSRLPGAEQAKKMRDAEAKRVLENLQIILDR